MKLDNELEVKFKIDTADMSMALGRISRELEFLAAAFRESSNRLGQKRVTCSEAHPGQDVYHPEGHPA